MSPSDSNPAVPVNIERRDMHAAPPVAISVERDALGTGGSGGAAGGRKRERVARLRRMRDLLAPFSATGNDADGEDKGEEQDNDDDNDEGARIQPNLVTRNGEIEKELERMRFLLVRVAGRVARLPAAAAAAADGKRRNRDASGGGGGDDEDEDDGDPEVLKRRKIEKLLDAF